MIKLFILKLRWWAAPCKTCGKRCVTKKATVSLGNNRFDSWCGKHWQDSIDF